MKKISLLIFGVLILTIALYASFSIWQFKDDKLKYIHMVNQTSASTTARKIQTKLEEINATLQNIVSLIQFTGVDREKTALLRVFFQNNPLFVSFIIFQKNETSATGFEQSYALFNKNYLEIYKLSEDKLRDSTFATLKESLQTQRKEGEYFHRHQPQFKLLTYILPLDKDNRYYGAFNISQEFLFEAISESRVQESFVIDEATNYIIAHNDISRVGTPEVDHPMVKFSKSHNFSEGSTEYTQPSNGTEEAFIGNFHKLGHNIVLISYLSKEKAFAGVRAIMLNTLFFAAALLGLAIIIGVLFSKTLTAPLQKLMVATEEIAAGNYNVTIAINSNDEVGQLADYFRSLGKRLEERESQLEEATELAIRDGMTGLFNHRHFKSQLAQFFSLANRHNQDLSMLLIDIDHFKKVNDTYGHPQGDAVLKELSKVLKDSTRNTDMAARYGGEEFVVLLPQTDTAGAVRTAERIRENLMGLQIKLVDKEGFMQCTCSIGVATQRNKLFASAEELVKKADENLYSAKRGGRNRVVS